MKPFAVILCGLAVFLWLARDVRTGPFSYDEADYMYAAGRGWWANAFDSPALSLAEFVRIGLGGGQRAQLSELIRSRGDQNFYRHMHGPLYFYWLAFLAPRAPEEKVVRACGLIFPASTALAIYFGSLWILGRSAWGRAALGAAMCLWSPSVVRTSEIAPHQLYTLTTMASLLLAAKAIASGERRYWYAAVAAAGLAFATLEVAFVLVATLAAVAWRERHILQADWRTAARSAGVFVGVILAVWPAALLKLTFIKSYLFMGYLALFRKGAWGEVTFLETWRTRLADSPAEWVLIVVAVVVWLRRREPRAAAPFLLYGALMLALLLPIRAPGGRYLLPYLPVLAVFAGWTLAGAVAERRAAVAALALFVAANSARYVIAHPMRADPRPPALLTAIHERGLEAKRLLVPQEDLPMLHYYFPQARLKGYPEGTPPAARRVEADAAVYPGYPVRID